MIPSVDPVAWQRDPSSDWRFPRLKAPSTMMGQPLGATPAIPMTPTPAMPATLPRSQLLADWAAAHPVGIDPHQRLAQAMIFGGNRRDLGGEGGFGPGRNLRGGNLPGDWGKWSSGLLRGLGWALAPGAMLMAREQERRQREGREQQGPGGSMGGSYGPGDRTGAGPGGTLGHI